MAEVVERKGLDWLRSRPGLESAGVLAKAEALAKHMPRMDSDHIDGSSPPGAFVGRFGYPKVQIGPLIPPAKGDTRILDAPEMWFGSSIQTVIDYRVSLVRGRSPLDVNNAADPGRYLLDLQDMAMSKYSVDVDARFEGRPKMVMFLSEDTQPFGPTAAIQSLTISPSASEQKIEKPYYDGDLKSVDAMIALYESGVEVSRIQRVLSLGMLGVQKQRKMVPTRWSITAVDDTVSKHFLREVKRNNQIGKHAVYTYEYLDNFYAIILSPRNWSFEWIEAFMPGAAWNEKGLRPTILGDYEPYKGRTTYASCGGCYYAARLAVVEALYKMRRQASALVLREARSGYILPLGTWHIRESVRAAFGTQPKTFDDFHSALQYACMRMQISEKTWSQNSVIVNEERVQPKLSIFLQSR